MKLTAVLLVFFSACEAAINNNWAVLIDTSAYWFNYRHASNILGVYEQIKQRGIPDSNIILMVAEDLACNARNVFPGTVVNNELKRRNLVAGDVEIDYRGAEVSVDNLIRLLTDRNSENVTKNKLLLTDENSNILIYMTGHGGENFMKFRNVEEVSSHDLSAAFQLMWQQRRYKEILFVVDTCQAASMLPLLKAPNIYGMASSKVGESSYSYTVDSEIGLSVVDRFSHKFYEFLKESTPESTVQDFITSLDPEFLGSTPIFRGDLMPRPANEIKIYDFISWSGVETQIEHIEPCNRKYNANRIEYTDFSDHSRTNKDTETERVYTLTFSNTDNRYNYLFTGLLVSFLLIKSIL